METSKPKRDNSMASVTRAYYGVAHENYQKKESELTAALRHFSHKDHLVFNFTKTGTFSDKLTSIQELVSVA